MEKEKEKFSTLTKFSRKYHIHFFPLGFHQEYVMANSFPSMLIGNILNVDLGYSIVYVTTF